MKQPNDLARLRHMLDAAEKATHLIQGRKRGDLEHDEMLTLALTRLVEIFGEAANGVSDGLRAAHPDIPWRDIIGARNRLIHGYFDVDLDIVWQILSSDLPPLIEKLKKMLDHV